jgi:hypothetical protein
MTAATEYRLAYRHQTRLAQYRLRGLRRFGSANGATDTPCRDCRADTLPTDGGSEFYMVHDRVWEAAGMTPNGYLCIGCLEQRLGRRLHRADFASCDLNSLDAGLRRYAWWWRTGRLVDRLLAPSPEDGIQLELW